MPRLTKSSAWRTIATHRDTLRGVHMRSLFAADAKRFDRFSLRAAGIFLDCSKNLPTEQTLSIVGNSFVQWSVGLGKQLANRVLAEVESSAGGAQHDASTAALIGSLLQERDLGP